MRLDFLIVICFTITAVKAGCGCLKCSKNLKVVSPPDAPIKIIYKGGGICSRPKALPFSVQIPLPPPPPPPPQFFSGYKIEVLPTRRLKPACASTKTFLPFKVEIPLPPPPPSIILSDLIAAPDRIVMPAPEICPPFPPPTIPSPIFEPLPIEFLPTPPVQELPSYMIPPLPLQPLPLPPVQVAPPIPIWPTLPEVPTQTCGCRYKEMNLQHLTNEDLIAKSRKKRDLNHLENILSFLPSFIRLPVEQTLNLIKMFVPLTESSKFRRNQIKYMNLPTMSSKFNNWEENSNLPLEQYFVKSKPLQMSDLEKSIFFQKLRLLNNQNLRSKRSVTEISLPFFRIADASKNNGNSNEILEKFLRLATVSKEQEEDEDEEDNEIVGKSIKHHNLMKPFHLTSLLPHNALFYFLNTPIRFFHHLYKLKDHITPVLHLIPKILIDSKHHFFHFGKHLQSHFLHFFSNLIGNFGNHASRAVFPGRRLRRDVYGQPDISFLQENVDPLLRRSVDNGRRILTDINEALALSEENEEIETNERRKRFILKVVDEDEVQEFLREKLEHLDDTSTETSEEKNGGKKKFVIEQLMPKIIVDNNGRSFVEINGMKRPLFNKLRKPNKIVGRASEAFFEDEDMKKKISNLIDQAKTVSNQNIAPYNSEMHIQMIKEKITLILNEVQELINDDLEKYLDIYDDLMILQDLKVAVTEEWKRMLIENKGKEMKNRIGILNALREVQAAKDKVLSKVAQILKNKQNFMSKNLIKMLIRLQKLQCIINRAVEDFEEKIRVNTEFQTPEEIKRIEYLDSIVFISGKNHQEIENSLKTERDIELEKQIDLLENLRKLLDIRSTTDNQETINKINEAARLIWESKNIKRLQKDSITAINEKLNRCQKLRKELKILFDLQRQSENVEIKQKELIGKIINAGGKIKLENTTTSPTRLGKRPRKLKQQQKTAPATPKLLSRSIVEDLKPIKVISNGYVMTGYKLNENRGWKLKHKI